MEIPRFSYHDNPLPFVTQFETIFFRLLKREQLDLYDLGVSFMFEIIATRLMAEIPGRECHCYDGVSALEGHTRKARQIEFTGEMWIMDYINLPHRMWKEDFRATVTDKSVTKQGICILLQIGEDRAEGNLADAFGKKSE